MYVHNLGFVDRTLRQVSFSLEHTSECLNVFLDELCRPMYGECAPVNNTCSPACMHNLDTHSYLHTRARARSHTYTRTCIYKSARMSVHVRTHPYVHAHRRTKNAHTRTHMLTHMYVHILTHTHTRTPTRTRAHQLHCGVFWRRRHCSTRMPPNSSANHRQQP